MGKHKNTLPGKGDGYCPKCSKKRNSFSMFRYIKVGINEWNNLKKNIKRLFFTDHAWERYHERQFTALEVKTVLRNSWLVERQDSFGKFSYVVLVYMNNNPVHLVVKQEKTGVIAIITIYDPRTEAWRWSKDFKQRVCWCNKGIN